MYIIITYKIKKLKIKKERFIMTNLEFKKIRVGSKLKREEFGKLFNLTENQVKMKEKGISKISKKLANDIIEKFIIFKNNETFKNYQKINPIKKKGVKIDDLITDKEYISIGNIKTFLLNNIDNEKLIEETYLYYPQHFIKALNYIKIKTRKELQNIIEKYNSIKIA